MADANTEVTGPDGQVFAFPADTPEPVMRTALLKHYQTGEGKGWEQKAQAQAAAASDASASGRAGDASAAVGRGLIEGIPVIGAPAMGLVNRGVAGIRALKNDTRYSDELKNVQDFGERTAQEHPYATLGGELAGGALATAPLVAAAPAAFGAGAGSLGARAAAGLASGAALGGADSAVRSGGDLAEIKKGALIGGGLGAAGPLAGYGIGRVAEMVTGGEPGMHMIRQATQGLSEADLAAAQALREGSAIPLSADEALNAATGGRAGRASQLARVAANSGGEGGQIASDFYAARPGQVEQAARAGFEGIGPQTVSPTGLGFDLQAAARQGVAQTPEGMALQTARDAAGQRVTPLQAGQALQGDLRARADALEAARAAQASVDYPAARAVPETVGIEAPPVTVERPGEPVVTPQAYSRPQFTDAAPRPLEALNQAEQAAGPGPESLARFVARNGGIRLDDNAAAADLNRFNVPGHGNVARPTGKGIDDFWRERLIEEGYFRPDADGGMARDISSELLRKLQNEQRGFPSYPLGSQKQAAGVSARRQADEFANAVSLADSHLQEELARIGVDPAGLHPDVRSRAIGAMVRGTHPDPLDAYEAVVNGMRPNPPPLSRATAVEEQIPDVRFGQVDPRPALAAVAEQSQTAKGDVRGALASVRNDLRGPDGAPDMSVAGLLHARERLDFALRQAQEVGDATKVRDLQASRAALDGALKQVPEVATADANFAANSRPLEPFIGNAPLAQVTRQDPLTGRMATPAEQVPSMLTGPTAAGEAIANGSPAAREALGQRLQTQILDGATREGTVSADAIRQGLIQHEDTLAQMPDVRGRLEAIATARDSMARVEASPLGRIANRPDVRAATDAIFSADPGAGSHHEVASAMAALSRNDRSAAEQLARYHLETVFDQMMEKRRGLPAQYGGAAFASFVRGNSQQASNLEASIRALPNGDMRWMALDKLLTNLEATGYRPQKGSDTAFNQLIQKEISSGKTHAGQALTDALAGLAAGTVAGGVKGGVAGFAVGARHGVSEAFTRARMLNNGAALARLLYDPAALPDLRALAKVPARSRNAEMFTTRLLARANGALSPVREPALQ